MVFNFRRFGRTEKFLCEDVLNKESVIGVSEKTGFCAIILREKILCLQFFHTIQQMI